MESKATPEGTDTIADSDADSNADTIADTGTNSSVAVIGGGAIGAGFTLMFAAAGHSVRIFEPDGERRQDVKPHIANSLSDLHEFGLCVRSVDEVLSLVTVTPDLCDALQGARFVQECVPEDLALKRKLFAELDALAADDAVLASSSSAITASEFAAGLDGRHRCLVAHPGNPPFLIRVVEIVPAPFTAGATTDYACRLLRSAGFSPVTVQKEVRGFVFNRLQGALLREAYCLVRDGVAGVEDIDRLVRDGLGLRWAVVGPFETADLNRAGGIEAHAGIMGEAYAAMGAERGQQDRWTPDLVRKVARERRTLLPLERWDDRVRWRDRQLMALIAAREE